MLRFLSRLWLLYQAIAFIVLIPVSFYYILKQGLPKGILLFTIPGYCFMSWASYRMYRMTAKPK